MNERDRWEERHRARPARSAPSAFVARHVARLAQRTRGGRALDVACGSGRHALLLAQHGFRTFAFDHATAACRRLAAEDARVHTVVADAARLPFRDASFAAIVQTRFLDRTIVPDLLRLLARGGLLVVETFLVAQHEATGHPRREFCLEAGELEALCRGAGADVDVLEQHEGLIHEGHDAAHLAAIAVCKV